MIFLIVIAVLVLGFGASQYAAGRFATAMQHGRKQASPENRTGAQMVSEFLLSEGVEDVKLVPHEGVVSDYFDPSRRCLYLRRETLEGKNLAAWALALHEAAHALQTGEAKEALKWRRTCISMCRYLPTALFILAVFALVIFKMPFRTLMIGFGGACAGALLLNLGTLAVEHNANQRLRHWLNDRLGNHPDALEKLDVILNAVAIRELGDLLSSPRYFFLSALPGSSKKRPE
ncbi:MAG: putative peptidase rane zinc metallopeptidase [Verrucomicrobiaceae bacterium]|nr:putative peptidase rane zinc metallopeptidase [Verrucomicrobiaceae bacterium]